MIFEKIRGKLEELQVSACFPSDFVSEEQAKIYSYFRDKLTEIVKIMDEYNNGWIPCIERLPEKFDSVLVSCEGSIIGGTHEGEKCEFVATGYMFSKDHWQIQGHSDVKYIKVTAWQPLPQPPKGE